MGIREDMLKKVETDDEYKQNLAVSIANLLSDTDKRMLLNKFKLQYRNHPQYDELVDDMTKRLGLDKK